MQANGGGYLASGLCRGDTPRVGADNPGWVPPQAEAARARPAAVTLTGQARARKHDTDLGNRLTGQAFALVGRDAVLAITGLQNAKIVVYGYTDDHPIGAALKKKGIIDNLDLSSRRADAVVRYLTNQDFPWATDTWAIMISIITFLGAPNFTGGSLVLNYTSITPPAPAAQSLQLASFSKLAALPAADRDAGEVPGQRQRASRKLRHCLRQLRSQPGVEPSGGHDAGQVRGQRRAGAEEL